MLLRFLRGHVSQAAAPFIFLVLFLVIVGGSLWITPRLARWMDRQAGKHKGYFDGMLTEDPGLPKNPEENSTSSEERNKP